MTTLNNARRALLEIEEIDANSTRATNIPQHIEVIKAYLDSLVPLNIENHIPGEKITAEQFHKIYGIKQTAISNAADLAHSQLFGKPNA